MNRKKGWVIGLLVGGALCGIAFSAKPVSEAYLKPYVQEQLHTVMDGTVSYDSLDIQWDGSVKVNDLVVQDKMMVPVLEAPSLSFGLNWWTLLTYPFRDVGPDALIGTVTIDSPRVLLVEGEDRTWNVMHLLKERESTSQSHFAGHVDVKNAEVSLQFYGATPILLHDTNLMVIGDGGTSLESVLSTKVEGHELEGRLHLMLDESADMTAFLHTDRLSLDILKQHHVMENQLPDIGGTITNTSVTLSKKAGTWFGEGSLSFEGVEGQLEDYRIEKGKGTIHLHRDVISLVDVSTLINGEYLRASGTVHQIFGNDPSLHVAVQGKEIRLASFLSNGMEGSVNVDAMLTGTVSQVEASADVDANTLRYEDWQLERLRGHIHYGDQRVTITDLIGEWGGGKLMGQGVYYIDSGDFMLDGNGEDLPLQGLPIPSMASFRGRVNGSVKVLGKANAIEQVSADIQGHSMGYESIEIPKLSASFLYTPNQIKVNFFNARIGEGTLTAHGSYQDGQIQLTLHGQHIDVSAFNAWSPQPLRGLAHVEANLEGSLDNARGSLEVGTEAISFGAMEFDRAFLTATLGDGRVHINDATLERKRSYYHLEGTVDLEGEQAIDLRAKADDVRLEQVLSNISTVPITGWASTQMTINGTLSNPLIRGFVKAWDGSIYGKLFESVEGNMYYDAEGIHLPYVELTTYGASITARGAILQNQIDIDLLGDRIPVKPFIQGTGIDLEGYIATQGHLGGTTSKPVFEGTVTTPTMRLHQSHIRDVLGVLYVTPDVLHLQELSFNGKDQSHYEVKGGVQLSQDKRLFGSAEVQHGDVQQLLALSNVSLPNLGGHLQGTIELSGTVDEPILDVKGSVEDTIIGEEVVGSSSIDAGYAGRTVNIRTLRIPVKDGVIAAKGTADLDGESDIQVAASRVPVRLLMPLFNLPVKADGYWNVIVNVTGQTKQPKVEFSTDVDQAMINGISLDQLSLLGTMTDNIIHIEQGLVKKSDASIKIYGHAPLAAFVESEYVVTDPSREFDLTIDMNEANLSVLPLMMSSISSAEGPIAGKVHVGGTVNHIVTMGSVELTNGTLKMRELAHPLTKWNGQILFKDNRMDITSSATMGKGSAGLSGQVTWNGRQLDTYHGALQLDKLDLVHEYFTGPLDGELYIVPRQGIPTLVGKINLHDVTASIPMTFSDSESSLHMGLDLSVSAGKNVRLYNSLLYDMFLQGDVKFEGTLGQPTASGQFTVPRGTLKYLTNRFKITEGTANFVTGSILPELKLHGTANVKSYRVNLSAEGPATQMKLKLTSDPSLSERQIISLLTFGRSVGNTSGVTSEDATSLVSASLQSLAFGYVEDVLQNTLGLDLVNITTGSLDGKDSRDSDEKNNFNVQIGKYVFPDLMVTLTRGLNNDRMSYGIQYDINRRVGITGWVTNTNKSFLGGQWRYRF